MEPLNIPWLKYVDPTELNEDYQLIVQAIGLEAAIKLAFTLPSVHFYLKEPEKVFRPAIERYIIDNFSGLNHRQLALQCRVSERFVYNVIASHREKNRPGWKQDTLL